MSNHLETRIEELQKISRRNRNVAWLALLAASVSTIGAWTSSGVHALASAKPVSIRANELVIVDNNGTERVRISGDVPDAVINGKRVPRGDKAAGILIYDATGTERGGYVTFQNGNAVLTLDTQRQQVVLLAADPKSGAAFEMWHGTDSIGLRSDSDGSRLTAVKNGKVAIQYPDISLMEDTCKDYRDIASRTSPEHAAQACQRRFTETSCSKCLGK